MADFSVKKFISQQESLKGLVSRVAEGFWSQPLLPWLQLQEVPSVYSCQSNGAAYG
jgi:hypothetical protein